MKAKDVNLDELMAEHDIRPTANRLMIARILSESARPLSMTEIEDRADTIDKSNIFRALVIFREKHFVHTIEDGSDNVRYELCYGSDAPGESVDDDEHCHFYCEKCHRTFCLENIPVPEVVLPQGYVKRSVNYVIKGLCPDCRR